MTANETTGRPAYQVQVTGEFVNVDQEIIHITKDRLHLCLVEHLDKVESKKEWIMPAGLLVSIVATLVAATFHQALGMAADVWTAIFIMAGLVCLAWLIRCLYPLRHSLTIEQLIQKIKTGDKPPSQNGGQAV